MPDVLFEKLPKIGNMKFGTAKEHLYQSCEESLEYFHGVNNKKQDFSGDRTVS